MSERVEDVVADIIKDQTMLKTGDIRIDVLVKFFLFLETIVMSDSLSTSSQSTGTFVWDTAKWGYADWG